MTEETPVQVRGVIHVEDTERRKRKAVVGHIGPGDVVDGGLIDFPLNGCPGCPTCGKYVED